MSRKKAFVFGKYPTIKFRNPMDGGLYDYFVTANIKFSRNEKFILQSECRFGEEFVPPIKITLNYVVRDANNNNKMVAILLLRANYLGVHPFSYKIPALKYRLIRNGQQPLIFEISDSDSASIALKKIYEQYKNQKTI